MNISLIHHCIFVLFCPALGYKSNRHKDENNSGGFTLSLFQMRVGTILFVSLSFLTMHSYSYAWDGTVTGYINTSDLTDTDDNHRFRITFTQR